MVSNAGKVGIAVAVIVVIAILAVVGMYNSFVVLDQSINGAWSGVENQYQRQADLIPNLVSAVSSAVSVETKFVKDVTAARTGWQAAAGELAKDKAGMDMTNSITAFVNAVAENYPTLQANTQYVALTDELSGTQNRVTTARGRYIEAIQSFNTAIKMFPGNVFAGMFGFAQRDYYQADISAMKTPSLGNGTLPT
jgi:LemA protein